MRCRYKTICINDLHIAETRIEQINQNSFIPGTYYENLWVNLLHWLYGSLVWLLWQNGQQHISTESQNMPDDRCLSDVYCILEPYWLTRTYKLQYNHQQDNLDELNAWTGLTCNQPTLPIPHQTSSICQQQLYSMGSKSYIPGTYILAAHSRFPSPN